MSRLLMPVMAMLALLSVFAAVNARELQQVPPPLEGCSASPGSRTPPECSGTFSGNQWDKDELECHIGEYQLKCDHDTDIVGSNNVKCSLDAGPLSSEIDFQCNVDSNCQVRCDLNKVRGIVPGATYEPIVRIMSAWKPTEDIFG